MRGSISFAWMLVTALGLCATPAHGRALRIAVERIAFGGVVADDVRIVLHAPGRTLDGARLELDAAHLVFAAAGYRYDAVRWRCGWKPLQDGDGWRCEGPLAAGAQRARLALQMEPGRRALTLRHAEARLAVVQRDDAPIETTLARLPVQWLQPWLAQSTDAVANAGTLSGAVRISSEADATAIAGDLTLSDIGVDAAGGLAGAAGMSGQATFAVRTGPARSTANVQAELRGAQLLAGTWYAELPAAGARFELAASRADGWRVDRLQFNDPQVLDIDYRHAADDAYVATLASPDLAVAWPRYGAAWGAAHGLDGMQASGTLEATIERAAGALHAVSLELQHVSLRDPRARFALDDAAGALRWHRGADPAPGRFAWAGGAVFAVPFAAGELQFDSADGALQLTAPARVEVLGGVIEVPRLVWRAPRADAQASLDLAARVHALDLAALSERAGWPRFEGSVSGELPDAHYRDDVLAFDGGLRVDVFDGRVDVRALRLERPFGVAPTLSADVALSNLDLQPLTRAFRFGEITGRLEGAIAGLRMVEWQAVAFDAELRTSTRAPERRISRRAVDDLSRVGGGGAAAGLQAQALKLFDSFAYARIGLRCRLRDDVCTMGGIAPAGDSSTTGYTIVEGAGLPRITVNGFKRRVDWPVLVQRLQAATRDGIRVE